METPETRDSTRRRPALGYFRLYRGSPSSRQQYRDIPLFPKITDRNKQTCQREQKQNETNKHVNKSQQLLATFSLAAELPWRPASRLPERLPGVIDAIRRDEHPHEQNKSTVECIVIDGVVAGGGYSGVCEVHQGITTLAVGVLPDALARTPRVDDGCVFACCDVVIERVVLRADQQENNQKRETARGLQAVTTTVVMIYDDET